MTDDDPSRQTISCHPAVAAQKRIALSAAALGPQDDAQVVAEYEEACISDEVPLCRHLHGTHQRPPLQNRDGLILRPASEGLHSPVAIEDICARDLCKIWVNHPAKGIRRLCLIIPKGLLDCLHTDRVQASPQRVLLQKLAIHHRARRLSVPTALHNGPGARLPIGRQS